MKKEGTTFRPEGFPKSKNGESQFLQLEHKRAFVIVLKGENRGREYEIINNPSVLGREEKVDIYLKGNTISRRHASIGFEEDKFYIKDLDSTNGTKINGKFIKTGTKSTLNHRDRIELGDVEVQFLKSS